MRGRDVRQRVFDIEPHEVYSRTTGDTHVVEAKGETERIHNGRLRRDTFFVVDGMRYDIHEFYEKFTEHMTEEQRMILKLTELLK